MGRKKLAKYPFDEKDGDKYLEEICCMNGWSDKNAILSFFSWHNLTAIHTKFHICETPRSRFLQLTQEMFDKLCEIKYSLLNLDNLCPDGFQ